VSFESTRQGRFCPTELTFSHLETLELENSLSCLPLNIGLPVLNGIDLNLGPGDFDNLSRHLSSPSSVLQKLPTNLNFVREIFPGVDWSQVSDEELDALNELKSLSNVGLGEDHKIIVEMFSS
jgi:hypothetical protein